MKNLVISQLTAKVRFMFHQEERVTAAVFRLPGLSMRWDWVV